MTLGPDTRTRRVGTLVIHLVAAAVPDGPELLHAYPYAKGVPTRKGLCGNGQGPNDAANTPLFRAPQQINASKKSKQS